MTGCGAYQNTCVASCTSYEHDLSFWDRTMVTEFDLICEVSLFKRQCHENFTLAFSGFHPIWTPYLFATGIFETDGKIFLLIRPKFALMLDGILRLFFILVIFYCTILRNLCGTRNFLKKNIRIFWYKIPGTFQKRLSPLSL